MATDHEISVISDIDIRDVFFNACPKQVQGLPLIRANTGDHHFCAING